MKSGESDTFRSYLQSLPDELLESVTEDYVWLSSLPFQGKQHAEFRRRRERCREECVCRGVQQLYQMAEEAVFAA